MKVLNLYAGIGGNRKFWTNCEVTAVEINPDIAAIYKDFFPDDNVIVGDAHEYLLNHFQDFDFIWSSPPCQSHSRLRLNSAVKRGNVKPIYPDMKLYQEIIFLENHCNGFYVVENVNPYYEPLIKATTILHRHLFWSNFYILNSKFSEKNKGNSNVSKISGGNSNYGFNLSEYKIKSRKDQILRNCVNPELGLHIFNCIPSIKDESNFKQKELFDLSCGMDATHKG